MDSGVVEPVGSLGLVSSERTGRSELFAKRLACDGNLYTRDEFLDHYGSVDGEQHWRSAGADPLRCSVSHSGVVEPAGEDEKRVAPDGRKYNRTEFLEYYGSYDGPRFWNQAVAESLRCAAPASSNQEDTAVNRSGVVEPAAEEGADDQLADGGHRTDAVYFERVGSTTELLMHIAEYNVWHEKPWSVFRHFSCCGQSCGCCRTHNSEDWPSGCECCIDAWTLMCVSKEWLSCIRSVAQQLGKEDDRVYGSEIPQQRFVTRSYGRRRRHIGIVHGNVVIARWAPWQPLSSLLQTA